MKKTPKVKILVVVEGGVVTQVGCSLPQSEVEVELLDHDDLDAQEIGYNKRIDLAAKKCKGMNWVY